MDQIISSYRDVWVNWKNFAGRTRRSAFWYAMLVNCIIVFILGRLSAAIGVFAILENLYALLYLIPGLALQIRRLHDTGRSGWWWLIALTGIGVFVLIYWWCKDSQPDNQYGPSPKGYAAAGYGPYGVPGAPGAPQGGSGYAPQNPQNAPRDQGGNNYYNGPEL